MGMLLQLHLRCGGVTQSRNTRESFPWKCISFNHSDGRRRGDDAMGSGSEGCWNSVRLKQWEVEDVQSSE